MEREVVDVLLWFETGWAEFKFPNNALYREKPVRKLELSAELSSETPGTNPHWLSDITLWVNDVEVGSWTSPGDYGDRRGKLTPDWWKLEGSQYGLLKNWSVTDEGSFVDGVRISDVRLADLKLPEHHSIRVRIGVKPDAEHVGGMNILRARLRELRSGFHPAAELRVTLPTRRRPGLASASFHRLT